MIDGTPSKPFSANTLKDIKFEIYTGNDNQYWFRLKAGNGEIIGKSEGYTTKQSAQHGIESVRQNSQDNDNFSVFTGADGQYYFHLNAKMEKLF